MELMEHKHTLYFPTIQGLLWGLAVIILLTLSRGLGVEGRRRPAVQKASPISKAQRDKIAKDLAISYGIGYFKSSLQMKENVDFLLTPAMIVQEAISEDIVVTYPTE